MTRAACGGGAGRVTTADPGQPSRWAHVRLQIDPRSARPAGHHRVPMVTHCDLTVRRFRSGVKGRLSAGPRPKVATLPCVSILVADLPPPPEWFKGLLVCTRNPIAVPTTSARPMYDTKLMHSADPRCPSGSARRRVNVMVPGSHYRRPGTCPFAGPVVAVKELLAGRLAPRPCTLSAGRRLTPMPSASPTNLALARRAASRQRTRAGTLSCPVSRWWPLAAA